jgi:hypothetical protein
MEETTIQMMMMTCAMETPWVHSMKTSEDWLSKYRRAFKK